MGIYQIEAPYIFDWENAIALDTMQRNRASSRREGKVSLMVKRFSTFFTIVIRFMAEFLKIGTYDYSLLHEIIPFT